MYIPALDLGSQQSFWSGKRMILMISIPIFVVILLLFFENIQLARHESDRSVRYKAELVMWESHEHLLRIRNAEQVLAQQIQTGALKYRPLQQVWEEICSQHPCLQDYWILDLNGQVVSSSTFATSGLPPAANAIAWNPGQRGFLYASGERQGLAGWIVLPGQQHALIWTAGGPAGRHVADWLGQVGNKLCWFDENGDIVYASAPIETGLPTSLALNGVISSVPIRTSAGDVYAMALIPDTAWRVMLYQPQLTAFQQFNVAHMHNIIFFLLLLPACVGVAYKIKHKETKQENSYRLSLDQVSREADKMAVIGELAASVAHEIRNPITSIKGFMQLLHQRNDDQRLREFTEIVVSEVNRVEGIIEDFLSLARPHQPYYQLCDLQKALLDTTLLARSKGIMQHVDVYTDILTELPLVHADCNQLKQVFINLSTNAIQAMPNGGTLRIRAWFDEERRQIAIQFIDNGQGIEPHVMERLGQRFVTTKPNGTGLGLPVSYRIIDNHHGLMDVQSTIGQGTTFTLTIPVDHFESIDCLPGKQSQQSLLG